MGQATVWRGSEVGGTKVAAAEDLLQGEREGRLSRRRGPRRHGRDGGFQVIGTTLGTHNTTQGRPKRQQLQPRVDWAPRCDRQEAGCTGWEGRRHRCGRVEGHGSGPAADISLRNAGLGTYQQTYRKEAENSVKYL